ncbi:hypothetical protein AB0L70_25915 [Kribbella sp. NPDC051952]|uniref:hypothetical protein n=1 Tax=Kribbella sp. NPDC051952 TaxID=3154851 RepID=UPI00342B5BE7
MPTISGAGYAVTMLNKILAITGALLVAAGVLLGFRSVSAAKIDCGSAFQPAAGITPMACDNALNSSSTLVTIFIGVGALCLLAALAVKVVHAKVVRDKVSA